MAMLFPLVLATALAAQSAHTSASDADFQAKSEQAKKNAAGKSGAVFDQAVGHVLDTSPDFAPRASACLKRYPGDHIVEGYFEFSDAGHYRVVLRPQDGFSGCFARALEGYSLPMPPTIPYLNPFSFTNHPGRPAVKKVVVTKDMLRQSNGDQQPSTVPWLAPIPAVKKP